MQDIVRIEPHRFSQDMGQQLSEELNRKFANKVRLQYFKTINYNWYDLQVVHKIGLCIILHDIISVGDSYIFPGDGASHTKGIGRIM